MPQANKGMGGGPRVRRSGEDRPQQLLPQQLPGALLAPVARTGRARAGGGPVSRAFSLTRHASLGALARLFLVAPCALEGEREAPAGGARAQTRAGEEELVCLD